MPIRSFLLAAAMVGAPLAHAQPQASAPSLQTQGLDSAIATLADHGLDPADYAAGTDRQRWMRAATHMLHGKLEPTSVEPDWTAKRRVRDLGALYDAHVAAGTLAGSLQELAPDQPGYRLMVDELRRLRLNASAAPALLTADRTLKPGMSGADVGQLQVRLGIAASGLFDADTEAAVRAFQEASGLDVDGAVGPATRRALNRGDRERIDQLRVNMERWRWLPDDLGRRHLRANIAGFTVTAYADGAPQRTHLTIVGKPFRKTPVFSDSVEYIVLNPWWETPHNLARLDKLPLFKRDPGAVQRLGFQVLSGGQPVSNVDWNAIPAGTMPYRIRQAPGPTNALGQVKIMFPNPHNVYLHDTPTRGLFAQRQRAFSSGCLRTQDPLDLSAWLLEETPGWDAARIDATVQAGKETRVNLAEPVPVHILYFTVETDAGGVRYLDDIYDRDTKVLAGLNARR